MKALSRPSIRSLLSSLGILAAACGLMVSPSFSATQSMSLSASPSIQLFEISKGSFLDVVNFKLDSAGVLLATVASFDMPLSPVGLASGKKDVESDDERSGKSQFGNSGRGNANSQRKSDSRKSRNEGRKGSSEDKGRQVIAMPSVSTYLKHISGLNVSLFDSGNELLGSWSGSPVSFVSSLASGSYRVEVSGIADGRAGGAYVLGLAATSNPVISPIPEPQTWMLMIGGLALFGALVRRRPEAELPFSSRRNSEPNSRDLQEA
jgi:PEP-CTERM motif